MRLNRPASWELRVGEFRVYFEVEEGDALVSILAIGVKIRNKVSIGGDEVEL
jgi:hypothetical protein